MLPGWDKLQDLRGQIAGKPVEQPPQEKVAEREVRAVTSEKTIKANADRISAFATGIKEGKRMSLLGKMQHLTEDAEAFTNETSDVLDGIADKIKTARAKRDEAKAKHHGYYDGIIAGVEDSVKVIDRLSNGPLSGDGK